ncbi:MAG: hypothetical protein OXU20_24345 [Myxococcales bacterium]|nr:hypothetical protein [Myxococcales bacterium]
MMLWNFGYWGYIAFVVTFGALFAAPVALRHPNVGQRVMFFVMAAWCFLPKGVYIDLPGLPPIVKEELMCLFLLLGLAIHHRGRLKGARFMRGADLLFLVMILNEFMAYRTNPEPIVWGPVVLPALTLTDALYAMFEDLFVMIVPFFLGRAALRVRRDASASMLIIAQAGMIYIPLIFFELRMSPVVHEMVYGYTWFSDFLQSIRSGGWRPNVFMGHGLVLGMMWVLVMMSTALLYRMGRRKLWRVPLVPLLVFLAITMVLIKAKAAMVMGFALTAMVLWAKPTTMVRTSGVVGILLFAYPILHFTDSFPQEELQNALSWFGKERVESMQFRFDQETLLSARARERLWFGWGGYGRERLYDDYTGDSLSVQDGHWIIIFGIKGLVGFVAHFGLWAWPLFATWARFKNLRDPRDRLLVATLALMLAAIVFNMVPNGSTAVMPAFIGGGLIALTRTLPLQARRERLDKANQDRPMSGGAPPANPSNPHRPQVAGG